MDDGDRARFVHNLFVMNDSHPAPNHILEVRGSVARTEHKRNLLVRILAWCLMPNHYHLLVSPIDDDLANLSLFAQKFGMGYSKFFNEKYQRSGALWQGKYRKIHVTRDAHFLYVPFYIHLNPLDLVMPEWREGRVRDMAAALKALSAYRWSSFRDYAGEKNFPSLIDTTPLTSILGSRSEQEKVIQDIIGDMSLAGSSFGFEM